MRGGIGEKGALIAVGSGCAGREMCEMEGNRLRFVAGAAAEKTGDERVCL